MINKKLIRNNPYLYGGLYEECEIGISKRGLFQDAGNKDRYGVAKPKAEIGAVDDKGDLVNPSKTAAEVNAQILRKVVHAAKSVRPKGTTIKKGEVIELADSDGKGTGKHGYASEDITLKKDFTYTINIYEDAYDNFNRVSAEYPAVTLTNEQIVLVKAQLQKDFDELSTGEQFDWKNIGSLRGQDKQANLATKQEVLKGYEGVIQERQKYALEHAKNDQLLYNELQKQYEQYKQQMGLKTHELWTQENVRKQSARVGGGSYTEEQNKANFQIAVRAYDVKAKKQEILDQKLVQVTYDLNVDVLKGAGEALGARNSNSRKLVSAFLTNDNYLNYIQPHIGKALDGQAGGDGKSQAFVNGTGPLDKNTFYLNTTGASIVENPSYSLQQLDGAPEIIRDANGNAIEFDTGKTDKDGQPIKVLHYKIKVGGKELDKIKVGGKDQDITSDNISYKVWEQNKYVRTDVAEVIPEFGIGDLKGMAPLETPYYYVDGDSSKPPIRYFNPDPGEVTHIGKKLEEIAHDRNTGEPVEGDFRDSDGSTKHGFLLSSGKWVAGTKSNLTRRENTPNPGLFIYKQEEEATRIFKTEAITQKTNDELNSFLGRFFRMKLGSDEKATVMLEKMHEPGIFKWLFILPELFPALRGMFGGLLGGGKGKGHGHNSHHSGGATQPQSNSNAPQLSADAQSLKTILSDEVIEAKEKADLAKIPDIQKTINELANSSPEIRKNLGVNADGDLVELGNQLKIDATDPNLTELNPHSYKTNANAKHVIDAITK